MERHLSIGQYVKQHDKQSNEHFGNKISGHNTVIDFVLLLMPNQEFHLKLQSACFWKCVSNYL